MAPADTGLPSKAPCGEASARSPGGNSSFKRQLLCLVEGVRAPGAGVLASGDSDMRYLLSRSRGRTESAGGSGDDGVMSVAGQSERRPYGARVRTPTSIGRSLSARYWLGPHGARREGGRLGSGLLSLGGKVAGRKWTSCRRGCVRVLRDLPGTTSGCELAISQMGRDWTPLDVRSASSHPARICSAQRVIQDSEWIRVMVER
ncbi:hypothetical protein C8Q80DRAFT_314069 [Daedaleopsis nitida]|nr:hypothetical protein C8Q80DRAFT_314069 [Daedaleopsis nitida]